jgi:hypothetical protein
MRRQHKRANNRVLRSLALSRRNVSIAVGSAHFGHSLSYTRPMNRSGFPVGRFRQNHRACVSELIVEAGDGPELLAPTAGDGERPADGEVRVLEQP